MTSETLIQLAWAQTWQIAAVALFAVIASRLGAHSRSHLALLLWTVVFVKCLIPPLWSSPLGVFSWVQLQIEPTPVLVTAPAETAAGRGMFVAPSPAADSAAGGQKGGFWGLPPLGSRPSGAGLLSSLWLAGALAVAGTVLVRGRQGRRWIERTRVPVDPDWQRRLANLGGRLGLRQRVELIVCGAPLGPAATGVFRPRLILPRSLADGRRFEDLEAILAHELIHIRRRDIWLLVLERVAKILWWFHPLVWYAGRQTARFRERCCDAETVACLGCRPATYARTLLAVLEHLQVARRGLSLAPGVRPAEVTLKRLEMIMRESHTFRKRTPRYAWLMVGLAATVLLPGSPLVLRSQADPADSPEVAAKVEQLENVGRQAGLSREEVKALIDVAKETQGDKRKLVQALCSDRATAIQKQAFEKIVRVFGHPLEDDLWKLRDVAKKAGLTSEETEAAEKVALATGFSGDAILLHYETGRMSAIEKSAFEKVIGLQGHPKADEIEKLTAAARQAGLSDGQIQTLRGLAARAGWKLDQVVEWKLNKKLSDAEAAAIVKLEAGIGPLELAGDSGKAETKKAVLQLVKAAGCSDQETAALLAVLKKGEIEDVAIIAAVRNGPHSEAAVAGLKKLESLLGKIEDFMVSSHRETVGKLLKVAAAANLTAEETGAMLKVAHKADYDLETVKRLKAAGQLSDVESRVLEKIQDHVVR